jgi:hypothetical protein
MRRPLAPWHAVACAVLFLLCLAISAPPAPAQERMDQVLILKGGKELYGFVMKDTTHNRYIVRKPGGELDTVAAENVVAYSEFESVREAPRREIFILAYDEPVPEFTCHRSQPWYFVELRALGVKEESKFDIGGEVAAGFRIWRLSFGLGLSRIQLLEKWRTPVFVHLKYHSATGCWKPFAMLDAGFVYDTFTDKYGVKPAIGGATKRYSKMFGVGIGIDRAIAEFMDISLDGGYRFYSVAGDHVAPSCTQDVTVLGYTELHTLFVRLGVTF